MTQEPLQAESPFVSDEMTVLLSRLPPLELRILHLAMTRAAELEAAGQSEAAETVLLEVRSIIRPPARKRATMEARC